MEYLDVVGVCPRRGDPSSVGRVGDGQRPAPLGKPKVQGAVGVEDVNAVGLAVCHGNLSAVG